MIINQNDFKEKTIYVPKEDKVKFLSVDDYIKCLEKFEKHPMGQIQYMNMDFNFAPNNLPIGYLLKKDQSHCIILAGAEYNLRLYRGENKDNPNFHPTLKREKECSIEHCIEWIKAEEFKRFFKNSIYYERLCKIDIMGCHFEPNIDAIAQHYGFSTNYLDLTQSRLVAQFFALTDYNKETNSFFPIENFDDYEPTIYEIKITDLYRLKPEAFKVVGIQPFFRPLKQFAYAIDTSLFDEDLKPHFKKVLMTKDFKGSKYIYNFFDGGKLLFPEERILDSVNKIKGLKFNNKMIMPEDLLFKYCNIFKKNFGEYRCKLSKLYNITTKKKFAMFPNEEKFVHTYFSDVLFPWIHDNVGFFEEMQLPPI